MPTRKLYELRKSLRNGELLIPNFQRKFIWDRERIRKLLASLMLNYPTGALLVGTNANSKKLASNKPISIEEERLKEVYASKARLSDDDIKGLKAIECLEKGDEFPCEFLLDGQQRITSLDIIFSGAYYKCYDELKYNNCVRWFLNLSKLGFESLDWPDLHDLPHNDVSEMIVFKDYRKTKEAKYNPDKSDSILRGYCLDETENESGLLIPLDIIFNIDTYEVNSDLISDYLQDGDLIIKEKTVEGRDLVSKKENKIIDSNTYEESFSILRKKRNNWVAKLHVMLNSVNNFEFQVTEVPSNEFSRLAGIFSVINISGVSLSTFDLLVAKTVEARKNLRDVFLKSVKEFNNELAKRNTFKLIPKNAGLSTNSQIRGYWSLAHFLGEKDSFLNQIDDGEEFPEKISSALCQIIALCAGISKSLGEDWCTRPNTLSHHMSNSKNPDIVDALDTKDCARAILRLEEKDWGFSDHIILERLDKTEINSIRSQATKQLLRSYFLINTRLGFPSLSYFPYRLMDLALACVLTDQIWEKITSDPNCQELKKIEWWFWASMFGGAYKEAQDRRIKMDIPRLMVFVGEPDLRWEDLTDLSSKELQFGILREKVVPDERFVEGIANRDHQLFKVDGYSDKTTLTKEATAPQAMGYTIRAFIIRNGVRDFKFLDSSKKWVRKNLNSGADDLVADHLFPLKAWNSFAGTNVKRNEPHPINSPMNFTWISKKSNGYWMQEPIYKKLQLNEAVNDDPDALDFLNEHLIVVDGLKTTHKQEIEKFDDCNSDKILKEFLEQRYERLRQRINDIRP